MKIGSKLTIEMEVKEDGVSAKVTFNSTEKTYFFLFADPVSESSRIDFLIRDLPRKLYIDAFLESIKR